ncbi:MAG TPA: outer membrane beta-barrel protein [Azospirillum sp.]|nr:outer membrane beta-barrel protein [Azospirillum sp.]
MKPVIFACATAVFGLLASGTACAESGPYVRLDTGWSWTRDARLRDADPSSRICNLCTETLNEIGSSALLSGGVGYRVNDLLRLDATVTRRAGFKLSDDYPSSTPPIHYEAGVTSWTVLLNGYVDVPVTLGPVRPFVGAGIGWSRNKVGTLEASFPGFFGTAAGGTRNHLAWQVTAGASVAVTPALAVDLSYRFLDAGDIGTDPSIAVTNRGRPPITGSKGRLQSHDLLVGMRYAF